MAASCLQSVVYSSRECPRNEDNMNTKLTDNITLYEY